MGHFIGLILQETILWFYLIFSVKCLERYNCWIKYIYSSNINIDISELEGMLCAYSNMYHQEKCTFKLLVMKDYGVKVHFQEETLTDILTSAISSSIQVCIKIFENVDR
ncbi:hypothetical protein H5410_054883 [Solanum commersonii]|uniref:Uncharacterized protein n=1 Tax=Solanum commersonii TaxID=4109 RepID=A0A9J5WH16_SOLCO|nr:hypothetical protein H5410_054883 [Solanum commersonii]